MKKKVFKERQKINEKTTESEENVDIVENKKKNTKKRLKNKNKEE